jgi:hypothetical protein
MMFDKRLVGTWRSDRKRTAAEIRARRDIPANKGRERLIKIFGKLTIRNTRTKSYTTYKGVTEVFPLRIVAKDAGGVVVLDHSPLIGEDIIYHIRFEERPKGKMPRYYWICLGRFREYFRRVNGSRGSRGARGPRGSDDPLASRKSSRLAQ